MYVWLSRLLTGEKKWDRISTKKKPNWIVKRCWRNPSCSNVRRPMKITSKTNRFLRMYCLIFFKRLPCCLRYYINIICWLTKHKYYSLLFCIFFFFCFYSVVATCMRRASMENISQWLWCFSRLFSFFSCF